MTELRTIATFRTSRFRPPADGLVAASDALVQRIAHALRAAAEYRVPEPEDEDWGAFFCVVHGRSGYQVNVAPADDPGADWMVEVQDPPRLLKLILGAGDPAAHKHLVQRVHWTLSAESSSAG